MTGDQVSKTAVSMWVFTQHGQGVSVNALAEFCRLIKGRFKVEE